jgi:hypothetical protein
MKVAFHEIRYLPGARRRRAWARRTTDWMFPAVVVAVVAAAIVAVLVGVARDGRGLRDLPPEQRSALLSRTVDELRQYCGEGRPDALRQHCRDLASFASQFEECRGECEALVHRELTPVPTR